MKLYDDVIAPSLKILAEWETAGKINGGIVMGDRAGVFVIEGSSSEEVDEMLQSLPFWIVLEWTVTPLVGFQDRLDRDVARFDAMKEAMQEKKE